MAAAGPEAAGFMLLRCSQETSGQTSRLPRAIVLEDACCLQQIGGPTSAVVRNAAGTNDGTARARKMATTTGRSGPKSRYRGPHSGSSRHRGVTQHK